MSTPWWRSVMMGHDVESTGVDTWTDRIVSWGCVTLLPDGRKHVEAELINPGVPIPPGATEVHGITDEHVQKTGNPPAESLWRLVNTLTDAINARMPIVGMNLSYDLTLLHAECARHGVVPPDLSRAYVVDIYVIDKHVDKWRKGSRKLSDPSKDNDLCRQYDVPHHGAHDAVQDIMASARVAYRICQRFPEVGNMSLPELHASQIRWHAEWAADFQKYLSKKSGNAEVVDPCWPYCPGHAAIPPVQPTPAHEMEPLW